MFLTQSRQPVRHLILQPLQKVPYVPIVDIEGAAVDIRPLGQLPHGDGLSAFFHQQLHQRQAQLVFRTRRSVLDCSIWVSPFLLDF